MLACQSDTTKKGTNFQFCILLSSSETNIVHPGTILQLGDTSPRRNVVNQNHEIYLTICSTFHPLQLNYEQKIEEICFFASGKRNFFFLLKANQNAG